MHYTVGLLHTVVVGNRLEHNDLHTADLEHSEDQSNIADHVYIALRYGPMHED